MQSEAQTKSFLDSLAACETQDQQEVSGYFCKPTSTTHLLLLLLTCRMQGHPLQSWLGHTASDGDSNADWNVVTLLAMTATVMIDDMLTANDLTANCTDTPVTMTQSGSTYSNNGVFATIQTYY